MKLCDICGAEKATTHIRRTMNGSSTDMYVCSSCAAKQGIDMYNGDMILNNLLHGFLVSPVMNDSVYTKACPTCRHSFSDILKDGRVYCPDCYITFYDQLASSVQRIHGKSSHVGKSPVLQTPVKTVEEEVDLLKKQLNEAIEKQDYERCVVIRDKIRELEGAHDE